MPPFPERESSILAKLKKKKGPGAGSELDDGKKDPNSEINGGMEPSASTAVSGKKKKITGRLGRKRGFVYKTGTWQRVGKGRLVLLKPGEAGILDLYCVYKVGFYCLYFHGWARLTGFSAG